MGCCCLATGPRVGGVTNREQRGRSARGHGTRLLFLISTVSLSCLLPSFLAPACPSYWLDHPCKLTSCLFLYRRTQLRQRQQRWLHSAATKPMLTRASSNAARSTRKVTTPSSSLHLCSLLALLHRFTVNYCSRLLNRDTVSALCCPGTRHMTEYSEYFGREVEIFTAITDNTGNNTVRSVSC